MFIEFNITPLKALQYKSNNKIEFLPSGKTSYAMRWELLNNAQHTIHIVTFSFMKDETTKKLFDLLKKKSKEGVKIRIIYDEIVNRTTFIGKWIKELSEYGIETFGYNSLKDGWQINFKKGKPFKQLILNVKLKLKQHFHEKYMIVDNAHLILGGINWGDKYAFGGIRPKAWRDTDVYIKGDVVEDVQLQFIKDYEMQKMWSSIKFKSPHLKYTNFSRDYLDNYHNDEMHFMKYPEFFDKINLSDKKHVGNTPIAYVAHKPYEENELRMTNLLLNKIRNAKVRIYWGCHGIRPPRIFAEYFAAAIKRGVKIVLITNSGKSSKTLMVNGLMGWMYWECTKHYRYLLENGIEIYEWQKPGAFHSKNLIIDHDFVSIGSFNIANGSSFHHTESNVMIEDREFCDLVFNQFTLDLKECKKIELKTFKAPRADAFKRILHERNKLIDEELRTYSIRQDLNDGKYKQFPLYEFIDIS